MTTVLKDRVDWSVQMDKEGHRDYKIKWLVLSAIADGPEKVLHTAGLPAIGSPWLFGNDTDLNALCWPNWKATPRVTVEPNTEWEVEQTFTTKPLNRCQDGSIENPLNEPDRISGGFATFTREAQFDFNGDRIQSSSHERIRGPSVERDDSMPSVVISKNLLSLPMTTFAPITHSLNDAPLWGLPTRTIKLSNVTWERQYYGTCTAYYIVTYEFLIDYNTFDRDIGDMGVMHLDPNGGGDKTDPRDFVHILDKNGQQITEPVALDGNGNRFTGLPATPGLINAKFYDSTNFLLLGIPHTL